MSNPSEPREFDLEPSNSEPEPLNRLAAEVDPSPRDEFEDELPMGHMARKPAWQPMASPWMAAVFFVLAVVAAVLFAPLIQGAHPLLGLVLLQIVCVLFPALCFGYLRGPSIREALALHRPSGRMLLVASLLGASIWFWLVATVLPIQSLILEIPEDFLEQREALFGEPQSSLGWLGLWMAAALTPAICEESLFRGAFLGAFRSRWSPWSSVLGTAFLFALFHFNPYQLVVTFLLGVLLGWIRLTGRSLLPAVLFHMINNTVVLAASQLEDETLPAWGSTTMVLIGVAGGILWLHAQKFRRAE